MLLHFKTWPEQADVYDPFHPGAREIYWDNLSKHIFSLGMDAWWLDATEPECDDKSVGWINRRMTDGIGRATTLSPW